MWFDYAGNIVPNITYVTVGKKTKTYTVFYRPYMPADFLITVDELDREVDLDLLFDDDEPWTAHQLGNVLNLKGFKNVTTEHRCTVAYPLKRNENYNTRRKPSG